MEIIIVKSEEETERQHVPMKVWCTFAGSERRLKIHFNDATHVFLDKDIKRILDALDGRAFDPETY